MTTLLTFLIFTGLVAFFSWRMTHRDDHGTQSGYFLAGRSLTWFFIGGSLLLTNLSTEQLVGLNGGAYEAGMQVMAWELLAGISMIVMALVFLPKYLGNGVTTVSEFLEKRYDRTVRFIVAILLILSLFTNLMPFVLYSGALFMREVFSVPEAFGLSDETALWLIVGGLGTVGAIYAIFGGLKAVAVSDTLNGVGLLIGGLAIPIFGLIFLGGDDGFFGGIRELTENHKRTLDPIADPPTPTSGVPVATLITGMVFINLYYWCTNQAIVQRTFGAKSLAHGQKGLLFAASLKMLGPFYLVLPGIIAFHLFATMTMPDGRDVVVIGPLAEETGESNPDSPKVERFKIIDNDGKEEIITAAEVPDGVYPVNKTNTNGAYSRLVSTVLPPWMMGFFAAVVFGAILSSFNSGLNSATTLFSVDLYRMARPDATESDLVRIGKTFGIIFALACIIVAPLIGGAKVGLFDLMKQFAALYNIPLITITAIGILAPRVPTIAAKVVLAFGFIFYTIFGLILGNTIFGHELHWLHVAGINGYLCVIIMLVIGAIRPRAQPASFSSSDEVDLTPWRGAKLASIAIALTILGIYLGLHLIGS